MAKIKFHYVEILALGGVFNNEKTLAKIPDGYVFKSPYLYDKSGDLVTPNTARSLQRKSHKILKAIGFMPEKLPPAKKKIKFCVRCGAEFEPVKKQKYCTKQCAYEYKKEKLKKT